MSSPQVFQVIQTLLASRLLPNCSQCSYEHNLDVAIELVKSMHADNVRVIEHTAQLLQALGA